MRQRQNMPENIHNIENGTEEPESNSTPAPMATFQDVLINKK